MPHVLAISSRVVRATVGHTLASFVLQRMGLAVWDVPTVLWDHQPGFGRPAGFALTGTQIATLLADFRRPEQAARTRLVSSGYFASADQVDAVHDHILALRVQGFEAAYCCDPICGDQPGLYVSAAIVQGLRTRLVPLATIITPNRHELGFLTDQPVTSNAGIVAAARALGRPVCLVTSAFGSSDGLIANILVTPDEAWVCETPRMEAVPNGTGDLMTALFTGLVLTGAAPEIALGQATASVHRILGMTLADKTLAGKGSELEIVAAQSNLVATDAPCPVIALRADAPARGEPHD